MKRFLMLCSLAAALGVVPALASAQDTVSRGGEVARTPSYATLMSALAATERATEQLKAMTMINENDVRVVDVSTLLSTDNEAEFHSAVERHKSELDSLHAAIQANTTLTNSITSQPNQPTVQDVVAAEVIDDKEVVLYVRPKQ